MGIPTVVLVGTDRLSTVPRFLELGSVVVIGPSTTTLARWQREWSPGIRAAPLRSDGDLCVDVSGRRVLCKGAPLPLTDLEFRVLALLGSEPGRACSFRELRVAGWGPGPDYEMDVFAVRSAIQRIRAKLRAAGVRIRVQSVRAYGFRWDPAV